MDQRDSQPLHETDLTSYQERFRSFLDQFTWQDDDTISGASQGDNAEPELVYVAKAHEMFQLDRTTMDVDFKHMLAFDSELADVTKEYYFRLEPYFRKVVQNFMSHHQREFVETEEGVPKEFWVSFYNLPLYDKLRDLKVKQIGKLVAFIGTCTRTSEVHPELYIGSFKCNDCGETVKNVEQQFKFTKPVICPNQTCGNRTKWTLLRDESAFVDWQRAKVQESSEEVPAGSLPRTIEVILRNNLVESVRAGDRILFTGNLIVVPDVAAISAPGERVEAKPGRQQGQNVDQGVTGPRFLGVRELTYRLAFMGSSTQAAGSSGGLVNIRSEGEATDVEVLASMTMEEKQNVQAMMNNPDIYTDVARSLAPAVFGAEDIKKAVLLMLLGGVHKQTPEGINLRGDINVAIVGDPSCAKSQILKYVAAFLPRAVYTSGKSSSAAGLTASVVKEPDSNEFCIEAGALMLADNGICCIDEFDKMDMKDQVAIHEAMEQQTISLAKAGVQATLSARTAILAAANPMGGRYDRSKPLRYNVALPPAILSRFDLLHVMIDEPDELNDERIANHIVAVHQRRETALDVPYKMSEIQNYIKYARTIKPELTPEACRAIVAAYGKLRSEDANPGASTAYRITVRQLEALVRLAEALARLHCQTVVSAAHVHEAVRLVKHSIMQVESMEADLDEEGMFDDLEGVAETVNRFNNRSFGGREDTGHDGDAGASPQPPGSDDDNDDGGDPGPGQGPTRMDADEPHQQPAQGPQGRTQEQVQAEARQALAASKQKTRVSQKKVDEVRRLLTMKLLDLEKQAEVAPSEPDQATAGITQHRLLEWYFDYMTSGEHIRLTTTEAVQQEAELVPKILQYLIKRESIIVVIETPPRDTDEDEEIYSLRMQRDRVLALNPNYAPE